MEAEGLLRRTRGTEDARQILVSLTEKGKDLEEKAASIPEKMGAAYTCNQLTAEEAGTMTLWLDELIRTLR